MPMKFKSVTIERDWKGTLKGELAIGGDFGRATLNLTEDLCKKIMVVCADNIVVAANQTATEFRREALQLEGISANQITAAQGSSAADAESKGKSIPCVPDEEID